MILARHFGARLREERDGKSLTQSDIALALGVNRSYVSDVECGKRNLTFEQAERFAAVLRLSVLDLCRPPAVQGEQER